MQMVISRSNHGGQKAKTLSFWMVNDESKCLDPLRIPAQRHIKIFNEIFNGQLCIPIWKEGIISHTRSSFPSNAISSILWHAVCSSV